MQRTVRGVQFHYADLGQGRPLFMLHGSPGDHRGPRDDLEPAFRDRAGWQRIYPDLPGHGRSPGSTGIADMDDYVAAVERFVSEVAGGRPVVLGGVSFGAYLALAVARRRPRRVAGLLLSVPEIHHSPKEDRLDQAWAPRASPSTAAHLPRGRYVEDTRWLSRLPWRDVSAPLYTIRPVIPAPTLLLFGRQDAPFLAATLWKSLAGFPRATFAILDGAGHGLWRDRGWLARALVRDWLERVENWGRSAPTSKARRQTSRTPRP